MGQKRAVRSPLSSALCCKTLHLLRPPCPCMFCSCRQSREVRFECPVNKSMASITGKRQCEWSHSCEWTCRIRKAALPCVLPTRPAAATSPPQGAVAQGPNADENVPAESWGPEACVGHCGTGSSPAAGVALPFAPGHGIPAFRCTGPHLCRASCTSPGSLSGTKLASLCPSAGTRGALASSLSADLEEPLSEEETEHPLLPLPQATKPRISRKFHCCTSALSRSSH